MKDAIDAVIHARPGNSSPSGNGGGANKDSAVAKQRSTVNKRRSQVVSGGGWKCNCGRCNMCLPSPSGESGSTSDCFLVDR